MTFRVFEEVSNFRSTYKVGEEVEDNDDGGEEVRKDDVLVLVLISDVLFTESFWMERAATNVENEHQYQETLQG